jgi:hypothetical protein
MTEAAGVVNDVRHGADGTRPRHRPKEPSPAPGAAWPGDTGARHRGAIPRAHRADTRRLLLGSARAAAEHGAVFNNRLQSVQALCMSHPVVVVRRDTRAWRLQVWVSFGVAATLCAIGLAWLPGHDLERIEGARDE